MAGYWPSSFLSFLLTKTKLRSIKVQKRMRPVYSRIVQTCLVNKGFIILPKKELFIGGPMQEILSSQDRSSCLLRQPIRAQNSLHLACSLIQPYNKRVYCINSQMSVDSSLENWFSCLKILSMQLYIRVHYIREYGPFAQFKKLVTQNFYVFLYWKLKALVFKHEAWHL